MNRCVNCIYYDTLSGTMPCIMCNDFSEYKEVINKLPRENIMKYQKEFDKWQFEDSDKFHLEMPPLEYMYHAQKRAWKACENILLKKMYDAKNLLLFHQDEVDMGSCCKSADLVGRALKLLEDK